MVSEGDGTRRYGREATPDAADGESRPPPAGVGADLLREHFAHSDKKLAE